MEQVHLSPVQRTPAPAGQGGAGPAPPRGGKEPSFEGVLARQLEQAGTVRFSKHALSRLQQRNIQLTPHDLQCLDNAWERARSKGARESLVLLDDLALVVSIRNQTVITATSAASRKENVFTNIDSAVIA